MVIERKKYIVDALHEVFPQLEKALAREDSPRCVTRFVFDWVMHEADEKALETLLLDTQAELRRLTPKDA
jgi:hypothetical protein